MLSIVPQLVFIAMNSIGMSCFLIFAYPNLMEYTDKTCKYKYNAKSVKIEVSTIAIRENR